MSFTYFTICAKNFLGYASSLYRSLVEAHGPVRFYVALCDEPNGIAKEQFPFQIITLDALGIPNLPEMIERYNITEINTSIKPFVFLYLFDEHPGEAVVYLDPDILVLSKFDELKSIVDGGATCVLTPHILEPAEFSERGDKAYLLYGIYNLGFCCLVDNPEVRRIVHWWARQLEVDCRIELDKGLFVDQKWVDLFPAFISNTVILRHPGYNVAYWNLSQRQIRQEADGWMVNGRKLRFFHFSGSVIDGEPCFSRHSGRFNLRNIGDTKLLFDMFRDNVYSEGHEHFSRARFGFNWDGASGYNEHTPKKIEDRKALGGSARPHLPLLRAASLDNFLKLRAYQGDIVDQRKRIEVDAIPFDKDAYVLPGFCACCQRETTFQVSGGYSPFTLSDGRKYPNWGEQLNCLSCGLVNRARATLHVIQQEFAPPASAGIYITEQLTTTYRWIKNRFPFTVGSEYFPDEESRGRGENWIDHEDVEKLSFEFELIRSYHYAGCAGACRAS